MVIPPVVGAFRLIVRAWDERGCLGQTDSTRNMGVTVTR